MDSAISRPMADCDCCLVVRQKRDVCANGLPGNADLLPQIHLESEKDRKNLAFAARFEDLGFESVSDSLSRRSRSHERIPHSGECRVWGKNQPDFSITAEPVLSPPLSPSDPYSRKYLSFNSKLIGGEMKIVKPSTVVRTGRIGGSRMVLSMEGITTGKAEWKVRIDRTGITPCDRMGITHGVAEVTHKGCSIVKGTYTGLTIGNPGIRLGVASSKANLDWYVGFDAYSIGVHNDGSVWHNGIRSKSRVMDRDCRTASFSEGHTVTVILDMDQGTVQFAINDVAVPGVHYISSALKSSAPVYLAASMLWPGEQMTMVEEDFFD